MNLVAIDEITGLVRDCDSNSGWRAITVFRELVEKTDLKTFTVVALAVDYGSPLSNYNRADRLIRAMEEIFGDREYLDLSDELLQKAIDKYEDLQYNANLEQDRLNNEIHIRLLERLKKANKSNDDSEIERIRKSLNSHQDAIIKFKKFFDKKKEMDKSVTENGYELSRIEQDLLSRKNSKFAIHGDNIKNPNKLEL